LPRTQIKCKLAPFYQSDNCSATKGIIANNRVQGRLNKQNLPYTPKKLFLSFHFSSQTPLKSL